MTAALAVPDANPFGADNMFGYMNSKQIVWLTILAFIFVYLNLGSVCSHCLYNSATGWSRILNGHMRVLAVVLGAIGIIVAATNIWSYFIEWLTILGILVPPIGAIILVDQYLFQGDLDSKTDWRVTAFIAWAAGSLAGLLIEFNAKNFSTAVCSFLTAAIVYVILCMVKRDRQTA